MLKSKFLLTHYLDLGRQPKPGAWLSVGCLGTLLTSLDFCQRGCVKPTLAFVWRPHSLSEKFSGHTALYYLLIARAFWNLIFSPSCLSFQISILVKPKTRSRAWKVSTCSLINVYDSQCLFMIWFPLANVCPPLHELTVTSSISFTITNWYRFKSRIKNIAVLLICSSSYAWLTLSPVFLSHESYLPVRGYKAGLSKLSISLSIPRCYYTYSM